MSDQAGALEALVATMKSHPDDPRVQSWSAYAAQRISSGDDAAGLKRQKKAKEARRVFMNIEPVDMGSVLQPEPDCCFGGFCVLFHLFKCVVNCAELLCYFLVFLLLVVAGGGSDGGGVA